MHVLWCVFEQTVASIMILDVVQRDGLEAPPTQGKDERIPSFQYTVVPPVFLQSHLTTKLHTHVNEKCGIFLLTCQDLSPTDTA